MTVRDFYEYAKSIQAEEETLTIIYNDYNEGNGEIETIYFTPDELCMCNSAMGFIIDAR